MATKRGLVLAQRNTRCEMKPRIDPVLRDLLGLSLLAAGGCGLALSQGDLLFVAIFGGACAVIAIEALRRLP